MASYFPSVAPTGPPWAVATRTLECPAVFSFIEAPNDACRALAVLAGYVSDHRTNVIGLDQANCTLIDHGAQSVLTALAKEAMYRGGVRFKGRFPDDMMQKEIVLATGTPRELKVPLPEPAGFMTFRLTRGRRMAASAYHSSHKEVQAGELVHYVNRCLREYGCILSDEGDDYLGNAVSEILGNAEDHSDTSHWWLAAYLRRPEGRTYGDCHITVFNVGQSMYESLQTLPDDALLRRGIEDLVEHHRSKGLFRPHWSVENLWTLYALQEGVSRYNKASNETGTRGVGTIRLIEMFHSLGQTASGTAMPRMCIVSGNTHILFDERFHLHTKETGEGQMRKVIAFNDDNDLQQPPHRGRVSHMKHRFPGTLISLRFYLDGKYLDRMVRS